ncbi:MULTISPECIES: TetR/AcrR family transcriptional regulator [Brevibacterium]|uniref:TetR/AcrR family transcriptional regulator n=1 Tax=Brevibacterium casei TaxID=33889 RepID=A0A7T4DJS8_9MICO|nr:MULTISPECIES: TetR/AcrR family transcriptional regulator [Brevibacterium]QQB15770.1 TetR/AcrR family transcriptional regulator [Brevibacterium casei]
MTTTTAEDPLTPPQLTAGAQRILETAAGLFYSRGLHAVGVDTIAHESGRTKRTLYDRFGSKDALVVTYLQVRHHTWWSRLEQRLAALDVDDIDERSAARDRVLAVVDSYSLDADTTAERGCAFVNAAAELPADHPGRAVIRAHKARVVDLLAGILDTGGHPAPEALAEHVFLILEGAIVHRGLDGDDHRLQSARALIGDLLA